MGKSYDRNDPNRPRKAGKHSRNKGRDRGHVQRRTEEKSVATPRGGWRDRTSGQDWTREEVQECRGMTGAHPRDLDDNQRRKALGIVRKVLVVQAEIEAAKVRRIREDEEIVIRAYSVESTVGQDRANMVLRLTGRHIGALNADEREEALKRADNALQGVKPLLRPDLVVYGADKRLYEA